MEATCVRCGEPQTAVRIIDAGTGWCTGCLRAKCDVGPKRRLQPYLWDKTGRTRTEESFKQRAGYPHDKRLGARRARRGGVNG